MIGKIMGNMAMAQNRKRNLWTEQITYAPLCREIGWRMDVHWPPSPAMRRRKG